MHIAEAQIFRDIGKEGNLFDSYYTIPESIKPNSLHIYFSSLPIFRNGEEANRVYYLIYIILLPLSVFLLIRALKGNIAATALSYLFIINHSVHWGFTGYTMSVPVLIIYVLLLHQYFVLKKKYMLVFITVFIPLLFLLHFQTAIFAMLISGICLIVFIREIKLQWILLSVLSVLPGAFLMITAYTGSIRQPEDALFPYLINYYLNYFLSGVTARAGTLWVIDNFFFLNNLSGFILACVFTVPMSAVIIYSLISGKHKLLKDRNSTVLIIFILLSFLCYIFLPDNIQGQNVIFERFSVFIFLGLIVLFSKIFLKAGFGIVIFTAVITLLHTAVISDYMVDFKKDSADFSNKIFPSGGNKTLSGYIRDNSFRGRPVYAHFSKYYTVRNNGIVNGLTDFRFSFIGRKEGINNLPHFKDWPDDNYNPGSELKNTDYMLTRGAISTPEGFTEEIKSGKWILYRNFISP
jgi:hypothetical protein